jgi:hypothetical protein
VADFDDGTLLSVQNLKFSILGGGGLHVWWRHAKPEVFPYPAFC